MKYPGMVILAFLHPLFIPAYSQVWKQHSDSAAIFSNQKKIDKAIEYYTRAKEELKKDSAWSNSYARICNNLGNLYTDRGEYQKAETLFLEAGQEWEKVFGKEHASYAIMCHNLGRLYHIMRLYDKAEPLYLEAKRIRAQTPGKEHPDYAATINNLTILYTTTRKFEKAEALLLDLKDFREKSVGKDHAEYAKCCHNLANIYWQWAQYEKAESLYTEAKQVREKTPGKETADYASTCDELANTLTVTGQYEKAEPLYIEAMQIKERVLGKNSSSYGSTCSHLAIFYVRTGEYENAEPLFLENRRIQQGIFGNESMEYASSCSNLGGLYSDMGQYEKSVAFFSEAKDIIKKLTGTKNRNYESVCTNLASLYKRMGQYDKAESLFLEAGEIVEALYGKEHPGYANYCNNLADLYSALGKNDKAEQLFTEAMRVWGNTLGRQHRLYLFASDNLAGIFAETAQYEKAEHLYLEARKIWKSKPDLQDPDYTKNCNGLASLYKDMGLYEKAETLYLEARQILERVHGRMHPEYASCCNNLGSLYSVMGEYEKAEQFHREALEIREKALGKDNSYYASSCNNLGALYFDMGIYDKAEPLFLTAMDIREKSFGKEHFLYAASCNNLAALYNKTRQFEKAETLYLEAMRLREKLLGKESPDYATTCNNLALLYMNINQYEKAESLYLEAKQITEKKLGSVHPDYAVNCRNLAVLYINTGEYEKAEPLLLASKSINEKKLGKMHPAYAEDCRDLAILYWNFRKFEKAAVLYKEAFTIQHDLVSRTFRFTSESEKQSFVNKIGDLEKYALSFNTTTNLSANPGFSYDISLASRNLILSSSQQLRQAVYTATDTGIINKYNRWISARQQLYFWRTRPGGNPPGYVNGLEARANVLEKELTRISSAFQQSQKRGAVTWQTVQRGLMQNEAAIEFVEFKYYDGRRWTDSSYYIALLLRKDKPAPQLVFLFEKRKLDTLLTTAGNSGIESKINILYKGNTSLYDLAWKPLEKYLSGISKIYFALAGDLFKVSFSALPINNKQILSDRYQLIQLNTTAAIPENKQTYLSTSNKIQLYGGVQYDADSSSLMESVKQFKAREAISRSLKAGIPYGAGWSYLPGTGKEVTEIESLGRQKNYPVHLSSGINATEESFKALNGRASPTVLHIATHGFFFPATMNDKQDNPATIFESSNAAFSRSANPLLRSGLIFAGANNAWKGKPIDGIEDGVLTAYEVSNTYLPNTKLVVLSACETALGDIQWAEGVYGLERAFKIAGVQNLVMSLWKISDRETAEFMQLFYKNLFEKQSVNDAFYHTQAIMKDKYRDEPYKWAAWILVK